MKKNKISEINYCNCQPMKIIILEDSSKNFFNKKINDSIRIKVRKKSFPAKILDIGDCNGSPNGLTIYGEFSKEFYPKMKKAFEKSISKNGKKIKSYDSFGGETLIYFSQSHKGYFEIQEEGWFCFEGMKRSLCQKNPVMYPFVSSGGLMDKIKKMRFHYNY